MTPVIRTAQQTAESRQLRKTKDSTFHLTCDSAVMEKIEALIYEAAECLGSGNLKGSYVLYLKALDAAVHELHKIKFVDQYVILLPDTNVFAMAQTCLRHVQNIAAQKPPASAKAPPPVPPKPKFIDNNKTPLPPLPHRSSRRQHQHSASDTVSDKGKPIRPNFTAEFVTMSDEEVTSLEEDEDNDLDDKPKRQSSTSNIPANNSLLNAAVRAFLPIPAFEIRKSGYTEVDELVLMATGIVDPNCLVPAQTSTPDSLAPPTSTGTAESVPSIPQAPLLIIYRSLEQKLDNLKQRKLNQAVLAEVKASLNRVRHIHMSATTVPTILQFPPALVAYQLTLIDSAIFRNIQPSALLQHTPKTPHPAIVASTDFFNYLTRIIEHSILLQQEASGRAQHINYWIKVATKCHDLKNFQTLKAIISALGTPPIQRLKRSWAFVPKKSMTRLECLSELMSEHSNYERYRERLGASSWTTKEDHQPIVFREPVVPFLGIFLHDMTYLMALKANNAKDDPRVTDLLNLFADYHKHPPYSSTLSPVCLKDLHKNHKRRKLSYAFITNASPLKKAQNEDDPADLSVEMQQCLATQYLLTRSWVGEKIVDELSLLREPPKSMRSSSSAEPLGGATTTTTTAMSSWSSASLVAPPSSSSTIMSVPPGYCYGISGSHSTMSATSSSGSLSLAGGVSTGNDSICTSSTTTTTSRPCSLEDDEPPSSPVREKSDIEKKFWMFGRKSVDHQNTTKSSIDKRRCRISRHFSFEDLDGRKQQNGGGGLGLFCKDLFSRTGLPRSSIAYEEPPPITSSLHPLDPPRIALDLMYKPNEQQELSFTEHFFKCSEG